MIVTIGVPKEVKRNEGRVGMTPENVRRIKEASGQHVIVYVQTGAGALSGFSDDDYRAANAVIVSSAEYVYRNSDIVIKVKELVEEEYKYIPLLLGRILFTYLHLAGVDPKLTELLLEYRVRSIAYEAVECETRGKRSFPLLAPMSKIAGKQAMLQAFEYFFERDGGYGRIVVVILGGGFVGEAALNQALDMGSCRVNVLDVNTNRVRALRRHYRALLPYRLSIRNMNYLNTAKGRELLSSADIVLSGVLNPGAAAPKVLDEKRIALLKEGAFVSDVAIDQGGSTVRSRVTHPGETYVVGGVTYSCVPNIPGSTVPAEATQALTRVTYPYLEKLVLSALASEHGTEEMILRSSDLCKGVQTWGGKLTSHEVARALKRERDYQAPETLLAI